MFSPPAFDFDEASAFGFDFHEVFLDDFMELFFQVLSSSNIDFLNHAYWDAVIDQIIGLLGDLEDVFQQNQVPCPFSFDSNIVSDAGYGSVKMWVSSFTGSAHGFAGVEPIDSNKVPEL